MDDCLIIGAGVIGLSLAYELAGAGQRVCLIDRGQPGRATSWAGAGILPPAATFAKPSLRPLVELSNRLHASWADELRELTGLDNGYRRCGAVYLAATAAGNAALETETANWQSAGVGCRGVTACELREAEPALAPPRWSDQVDVTTVGNCATLVDDEAQIRNPRHVQALQMACLRRGVRIETGCELIDFRVQGEQVTAAVTSGGLLTAGQYCLATGAWTSGVAQRLRLQIPVRPVRGQIALLSTPLPVLRRIVNVASRYLVPRADGHLLVGSTEEDVGFNTQTTPGGIQALLQFALELVPELRDAHFERSWAGLRPASIDGLPYLGRPRSLSNVFVAAGHFRSGLQLSTGTAVAIRQMMLGESTPFELQSFDPSRVCSESSV